MTEPISHQAVFEFLSAFETAQESHDFDDVEPLIHPEAVFRFNDGDYRGTDQIREAFESTWALDVEEEAYTMSNLEVEHIDTASAVVTFNFFWSGIGPEGPFEIAGRGTSVVVKHEGGLKVVLEHLSR